MVFRRYTPTHFIQKPTQIMIFEFTLNLCISVIMGFPTFYLSDLILIDASNDDYQCKVNWSPWTRTRISEHADEKIVIHQKTA